MQVAKVIGNIWATRKEEKLSGLKLLLVKPLDVLDETVDKSPLVAADTIEAKVVELQDRKRRLISSVMNGTGSAPLSVADVRGLLG